MKRTDLGRARTIANAGRTDWWRLHRDESGQAMTEYILIIAVAIVGLATVLGAVRFALFDYFAGFTTWINLPFP